jgi:uncharacterized protein
LLLFVFLFQTIYNDTPIRKNRIIQTGAKIQLGGLKNGLLSCAYQVGIDGVVNKLPKNATAKQTTIEVINLNMFIQFKVLSKKYIMSTMKVSIIAHPNSKKPRIEKDLLGTLHVHVNRPPLEGKANMAVIEALSKHFRVKKSCVLLISGAKSKTKTFEILNP